MDKYCTNAKTKAFDNITENRDHNKKFKNYNAPKSQIRDCFKEYSLEEKVSVLKNILVHNDKHVQMQLSEKQNICKIQKGIGVKECLQPVNETPFQTIISELRNTVMNSYWNKEVGKTRYQISNLPVGMDPLTVTFGKKCVSGVNMTEIFQTKTEDIDDLGRNVHEMYKKSHNSYLPGEKINRNYKKPFDQNLYFGKSLNVDVGGTGAKKRLTWFNTDTNTVVNSNLADFIQRTHSCVGGVKNLKNATLYTYMRHGKLAEKREAIDSLSILSDCPINNDVIAQQKYLEYINSLRQAFKKCDQQISFSDILEDLLSFDKDYTGILSEEKVFSILGKHKVHINKSILAPLLDLLQVCEEQNVKYTELLNLLNWRYDFPTLPKIEKIPLNCQHYSTTYSTMLAAINQVDLTNIPVAGLSYKDLDKMTAYSLIFPNIFTRYGLSPSDLSKLRNKEEIKNIFEAIGIQFPNDSFEFLWNEGLKKGGTNNVSVETFSNLLDEYDNLINKKTN